MGTLSRNGLMEHQICRHLLNTFQSWKRPEKFFKKDPGVCVCNCFSPEKKLADCPIALHNLASASASLLNHQVPYIQTNVLTGSWYVF